MMDYVSHSTQRNIYIYIVFVLLQKANFLTIEAIEGREKHCYKEVT